MACSVGHIGCTSFFPTKNLACMGDGGALFTNSDELAARIRMFASHGSVVKYNSEAVGLNSRLDEMQAAVLRVKLRHIDEILSRRRSAAMAYRNALKGNDFFVLPDYTDGHTFNRHNPRQLWLPRRRSSISLEPLHRLDGLLPHPNPPTTRLRPRQPVASRDGACVPRGSVHTDTQRDNARTTYASWQTR